MTCSLAFGYIADVWRAFRYVGAGRRAADAAPTLRTQRRLDARGRQRGDTGSRHPDSLGVRLLLNAARGSTLILREFHRMHVLLHTPHSTLHNSAQSTLHKHESTLLEPSTPPPTTGPFFPSSCTTDPPSPLFAPQNAELCQLCPVSVPTMRARGETMSASVKVSTSTAASHHRRQLLPPLMALMSS